MTSQQIADELLAEHQATRHADTNAQTMLRECPFCGSLNVDPAGWATLPQYAETPEERSGPACDDCGASAQTVAIWNTRSAAPAQAPDGVRAACALICDKHAEWAESKIEENDDPASSPSQMWACMSNTANDLAEMIREDLPPVLSVQAQPPQDGVRDHDALYIDPMLTKLAEGAAKQIARAERMDTVSAKEVYRVIIEALVNAALSLPSSPRQRNPMSDISITARMVFDILNPVAPAVESLSRYQEQCDQDGVMVNVSRQALDEVLNAINNLAIAAAQDALATPRHGDECLTDAGRALIKGDGQ
jgi:hypothetical protein